MKYHFQIPKDEAEKWMLLKGEFSKAKKSWSLLSYREDNGQYLISVDIVMPLKEVDQICQKYKIEKWEHYPY